MHRWKLAAGGAAAVGALVAVATFAPGVQGQDRRTAPRAEREVRLAQWFGGQIGVTVRDGDAAAGVVVDDVRSGGPAAKAGVKEKDVIVEFDGERVRSARQFSRLVDETPQGKSVKMVMQRDGQRTTVDVTPEAREFGRIMPLERFTMPDPPEFPDLPNFDRKLALPEFEVYTSRQRRLGVQLEDIEDQLAGYFGVKRGALVTSVADDTPAARAGLKAGDVITKIAGETVESTGDVRREIRRIDDDQEFAVEIVRDRKPTTLKVRLEPRPAARRPGTVTRN